MLRFGWTGVLLLGLCALPARAQDEEAPASADPAPSPERLEARERIARGEALFAQGDFEAALTEFERAYALLEGHPARPLLRFNIGKCHERLFRYDEAIASYRAYLDEAGEDAEDRDAVRATLETLDGMLGTLVVASNVPAEIWLDRRRLGDAPGSRRVPAGRHVVELRAPGHEPAQTEVQLAAGRTEQIELTLAPLAPSFEGLSPWAFALSTAAAGAAAIAAGITFAIAVAERAEVDRQLADEVARWRVSERSLDRIRTLTLTTDVLLASAGVLGVTALVLAFVTDFDEEQAPVRAQLDPTGGSVTLRGAW